MTDLTMIHTHERGVRMEWYNDKGEFTSLWDFYRGSDDNPIVQHCGSDWTDEVGITSRYTLTDEEFKSLHKSVDHAASYDMDLWDSPIEPTNEMWGDVFGR